MFYDCVVCLSDPCNEVHGILLVIDTKRQRGLYLYICVFVTFNDNAPGWRCAVVYCADVKRNH